MVHKLGLKLWSINTENYLREAQRLYSLGVYDYIELYVVPNGNNLIPIWKQLKKETHIPFAIHAPHYTHGLNFSVSEKFEQNQLLVEQTKLYAKELDSIYNIFHPGIGGSLDESIRQMKSIRDIDFLVENKPFVVPLEKLGKDGICVGSTFEDIQKIITEVNCGFCLDIGHSICCANYLNENQYDYIKKFDTLNPTVYHISDNDINNRYDKHLHLGCGNINFGKIFKAIKKTGYLTIETNKDNKENLNDFRNDIERIKLKYASN